MTPTCALNWCEKDAVWDDEKDEYALCCTGQHRIQVEQEAVRWMSQYRIKLAPSVNNPISANAAFDTFAKVSVVSTDVAEAYDKVQVEQEAARCMSRHRIKLDPSVTDDRRNVSAQDAACPGQAASNHKGDHPRDGPSERRIKLKEKINAKYKLAQLIITNMRRQEDEARMWLATMRHFILFIDRCFVAQMLQLWCDESEPMPERASASTSSSIVTSPSCSP